MKKLLVAVALIGLFSVQYANAQEPPKLLLNLGTNTATFDGKEYSFKELKNVFANMDKAPIKQHKDSAHEDDITFFIYEHYTDDCLLNPALPEENLPLCSFNWKTYVPIVSLNNYISEDSINGLSRLRQNSGKTTQTTQDIIDVINECLDTYGYCDGGFVLDRTIISAGDITSYGWQSGKFVESKYFPGKYLLIAPWSADATPPAEYAPYVFTLSLNEYTHHYDFKLRYINNTIPDQFNLDVPARERGNTLIKQIEQNVYTALEDAKLEAFDMLGRKVSDNGDLRSLSNAMYILRAVSEKKVEIKKVVKQ